MKRLKRPKKSGVSSMSAEAAVPRVQTTVDATVERGKGARAKTEVGEEEEVLAESDG